MTNVEMTPAMPAPLLPDDVQEQITALRKVAKAEIDRLIIFLDMTEDVDQDAAVDDDPCDDTDELEEELGSPERHPVGANMTHNGYSYGNPYCDQTRWAEGAGDEREHDPADEREHDPADPPEGVGLADGADDEPSLGSAENMNQARWASCDTTDGEPSLGWTTAFNQDHATAPLRDDDPFYWYLPIDAEGPLTL